MTIEKSYNRWAESYDQDQNPTRDLDQSVTLEILGQRKFRHTIEAGCGTGKNTPLFASISKTVEACDFSQGMLDQAIARNRCANVTFQTADLKNRWPFEDEVADLVSCNLVLEHIEDLEHIFQEAMRVLESGGLFFVSELHPFRQYEGSKARFTSASGEISLIDSHIHHVSDFLNAATFAGFRLEHLGEYSAPEDEGRPPRLLTMLFKKTS
jgi:ubiquinone/menaquinone biosynthesis C-methylase UbiE